ncbi:MAG: hypothetical protein NTU58_01385 [Candidatus Nealsonbacteria bacterium]|nr:hypothetical protein [Candidatus Nealsonbacteria bacterium]
MKPEKSELQQLFEKKSNGEELTEKEISRAIELITNHPVLSEENYCWVCEMLSPNNVSKTIFDIELCEDHAYHALFVPKK